jgi:hypothetical protein
MESDEYFIILDGIRIDSFYVRDVLYGSMELVRSFIYVAGGGYLSAEFLQFQKVIVDLTSLLEQLLEAFVGLAFNLVVQAGYIVADMATVLINPSRASEAIQDIINRLFGPKCPLPSAPHEPAPPHDSTSCSVISTALEKFAVQFMNILLQFPGLHDICKLLLAAVGFLSKIFQEIQKIFKHLEPIIMPFLTYFPDFYDAWIAASSTYTFVQVAVGASAAAAGGELAAGGFIDEGVTEMADSLIYQVAVDALVLVFVNIWGDELSKGAAEMFKNFLTFNTSSMINQLTCDVTLTPRVEATTCSSYGECAAAGAACVVTSAHQCTGETSTSESTAAMWDNACPCSETSSVTGTGPVVDNAFFCNFATGLCQAGVSPFYDPLEVCPPSSSWSDPFNNKSGLVASSPYYDALCYAMPVYKCRADVLAGTFATVWDCIASFSSSGIVSGPVLCRDFCDPSPFNADNVLLQNAKVGCFCGLGVSIGAGLHPIDVAASLTVNNLPVTNQYSFMSPPPPVSSSSTARRTLLGAPGSRNATACDTDAPCQDLEAMCVSAKGTERLCTTCPTRAPLFSQGAATCQAARCTCAPVYTLDPLHLPQLNTSSWVGNSFCAVVGNGYLNSTPTPLEYAVLRRCNFLRNVGAFTERYTGLPGRVVYDFEEAARVGAHFGVGALLGFFDPNNTFVKRNTAALGLDPVIAEKGSHVVHWLVNTVSTSFPSIGRLTEFAKKVAPDVAGAARFFLSTSKKAAKNVLQAPFVLQNVNRVGRAVQWDATSQFFRRLLTNPFAPPPPTTLVVNFTCPLLHNVLTDLTAAGSVLTVHFAHDVPRSVCRLLRTRPPDNCHGQGCLYQWRDCPNASWTYPLPPPPPGPPPSPPLAPSTGRRLFSSIPGNGTTRVGALPSALFSLVHRASGFDLYSYLTTHVGTVFTNAKDNTTSWWTAPSNATGQHTGVLHDVKEVSNALQCGYDTASRCFSRPGRLPYEVFRYFWQAAAAVMLLRFFGGGPGSFVASCLSILLFLFAYPVIMNRTYDLSYACSLSFTPVVPVCLVSDVQDFIYTVFPQHVPWPAPLVQRNGTGLVVFSCAASGFGDGVAELGYFLHKYETAWRGVFPVFTSGNWPAFRMPQGNAGNETTGEWSPRQVVAAREQCAILYSFTVLPLLLLIAVGMVAAVAATHIVLIVYGTMYTAFKGFFLASVAAAREGDEAVE